MLRALDAEAVRRWYEEGLAALDATRDEINSLNVFPVPDADTGTNLHLTLESAKPAGAESQPSSDAAALADTATEMARLSQLGARGSSGVILSQLLRGVAEVLAGERRPPRGLGLTRALERAVALAYAAVSHPVEGTMLTVARAAAEAARATGSNDLRVVVEAAVAAARDALAATPSQLDVLGQAGVVDAGGRGVVVLLEVLRAVVEERPTPRFSSRIAHPRLDALEATSASAPAYEVMYLIDAPDDRIPELRAALDEVGDAVVISGGDGLWTAHVHADNAAAAVAAGARIGHPHSIRISPIADHAADHSEPVAPRSLVVVADDAAPVTALRDTFAKAGAKVISSDDDVLASADSRGVVLLAASEAALRAAREAQARLVEAGREAGVVAAVAPVQLLAALAVHDPARPLEDDVVAMTGAAAATRHLRIRGAGEALVAELDGVEQAGSGDARDVAVRLVGAIPDAELVTVVADADVACGIGSSLRAAKSGLEVSVVEASIDEVWLGVE